MDNPGYCGNKQCITPIVFMSNFSNISFSKKHIYISGLLHGNEILGPNIIMEFILEVCNILTNNNTIEFNKDKFKENYSEIINNTDYNKYYTYKWLSYLLDNRIIIFTPFTNSYGYFYNIREEKVNDSLKDPNRDFPYFSKYIDNYTCFETITARTINEILNEFIVVNSLTFHGGTNVIGYPWGNKVHYYKHNNKYYSTEAPDHNAVSSLALLLKDYTKTNLDDLKIFKINNTGFLKDVTSKDLEDIPEYVYGDMTKTVYFVEGGLEDWAYAGSWEDSISNANKDLRNYNDNIDIIRKCNPTTYKGYNNTPQTSLYQNYYKNIDNNINLINKKNEYESFLINKNELDELIKSYKNLAINSNSLKCVMFLVETHNDKNPKEILLGNNYNIFSIFKSKINYFK